MLIEHLPPDSATAQAVDVRLSWTTQDYLLATLVDRIAELEWIYVSAHTEKGKSRPKRPAPVQRPGTDKDTVIDVDVVETKPPRPRLVPKLDTPEELVTWLNKR